jgi:hypothetical protein
MNGIPAEPHTIHWAGCPKLPANIQDRFRHHREIRADGLWEEHCNECGEVYLWEKECPGAYVAAGSTLFSARP